MIIRNLILKHESKEVDRHFQDMERIKREYSSIKTKHGVNSPQMNRVISLCKKDIRRARTCKRYWRRTDKALRELPNYWTFARLSSIYEQRKEYKKALSVCRKSLALGFKDDGTDGGIKNRMARIKKTMNK